MTMMLMMLMKIVMGAKHPKMDNRREKVKRWNGSCDPATLSKDMAGADSKAAILMNEQI